MKIKRAFRVWQRNFTVYTKLYRSSITLNFIEPMLYLLGMGMGIGGLVQQVNGMSYVEFIAPGLIASSSMFAATFECTYNTYIRMVHQKTFDAILATPVSSTELVMGEMLWGASQSVLYGVIIIIVLVGFGLVHSSLILLSIPMLFVSGMLFAAIGIIFASVIPVIYYFNYYFTLFITPMFLFSGIFFPLEQMPEALRGVAFFTPLYHLVNITRGTAMGGLPWADALWLGVVTSALIPYAVRRMSRRLMEQK